MGDWTKHDRSLTEEQFKMFDNKDESTRQQNPWFPMRLEKGNNLFLLIPDKRGAASAGGWVHQIENVKFPINCFRNIEEDCVLCKLYDYYAEGGENEVAKQFRPNVRFAFMGLDWKIFSEDPPSCLGDLQEKSRYDDNSKKCKFCSHVLLCQNRKYAVSVLTNTSSGIYQPLRAFLNDPDSDPTDFSSARLINIIRNAEGFKKPEGTTKYYDPKKVSDSEGGKVKLTDHKWILDVIEETAPSDLRVVFKPNVSVKFLLSHLSESEKGIVTNWNIKTSDNLGNNNSEESLNSNEKPTSSGLERPLCFGNVDMFSETDK